MKHLKLTKLLQKTLLIILACIIVFLILINKKQFQNETTSDSSFNGLGNQCEFVNFVCNFEIDNQAFLVQSSGELEVEERVDITISSPLPFVVEQASIEGVNMYMGRIPLIGDEVSKTKWKGWFMLGSCSEPNMRWVMSIKFKGQQLPAQLYFTTRS